MGGVAVLRHQAWQADACAVGGGVCIVLFQHGASPAESSLRQRYVLVLHGADAANIAGAHVRKLVAAYLYRPQGCQAPKLRVLQLRPHL